MFSTSLNLGFGSINNTYEKEYTLHKQMAKTTQDINKVADVAQTKKTFWDNRQSELAGLQDNSLRAQLGIA